MKKIFRLFFALFLLCSVPYIAPNYLRAQVILSDGAHIENCIAGESIVSPAWVYISSADGKMYKANATTTSNPAVGLVFASVTSGNTGQIAFSGFYEWPSATFTPGTLQYLSAATSGAMTTTAPSNVQKLGYSVAASRFKIDPQPFVTSGGGGGGVSSVTGSGVDNTDAANPVVNARPYKVYTALLSQSGTDAPTATVLENTLGGTVVWTRDDVGFYKGTLSGMFVSTKTWLSITGFGETTNDFPNVFSINRDSDNAILVISGTNGTFDPRLDDLLNKVSIEIRVYD